LEKGPKGVQEAFNNILPDQPKWSSGLQLCDVHKVVSVGGPLKPDLVACAGGCITPSSVGLIVDLKSQKDRYDSPSNILQVQLPFYLNGLQLQLLTYSTVK
jgi:hypothetical protein